VVDPAAPVVPPRPVLPPEPVAPAEPVVPPEPVVVDPAEPVVGVPPEPVVVDPAEPVVDVEPAEPVVGVPPDPIVPALPVLPPLPIALPVVPALPDEPALPLVELPPVPVPGDSVGAQPRASRPRERNATLVAFTFMGAPVVGPRWNGSRPAVETLPPAHALSGRLR
jgi:hypothetical protein